MDTPASRPRDPAVASVAVFFALVSLAMLALLVQWLVLKLTTPDARMDIAEWPFVVIGAAAAGLPLWGAIRLLTGHVDSAAARWSAYLVAIIGGLALLVGVMQLTIGVAWTLLAGGAVMLAGAIAAIIVLRERASG